MITTATLLFSAVLTGQGVDHAPCGGDNPKGNGLVNAIEFHPGTGNIIARADSSVNCAPASVTLTVPTTPVPLASQFQVSWTSVGTLGTRPCLATGGAGTAWADGFPLLPSGSRSLFAPITTGTATFGIDCAANFGTVSDSENVTFGTGGGGGATVSLTGPAQSGLGDPFTITWSSTGTTGATPCTPTQGAGGWNQLGALPPSGSRTLTGPSNANNVTFRLTCTSGSSTVNDTHVIQFVLLPPNCTGVTNPPTVFSFASTTWTEQYGNPFPLNYSANRIFHLFPGVGLTIAMTPSVPTSATPNGSLTYNEHSTSKRRGFMTISRCPRDFRFDVLSTPTNRCHTGPEAAGQLSLAFRLTAPSSPFACNLIPNVPYFINIHFGNDEVGPDNSLCTPGPCSIIGGTQGFFLRPDGEVVPLDEGVP